MTDEPPVVVLAFANDRIDDRRFLRNLARERRAILAALEPLVAQGKLAEPVVLHDATAREIVDTFRKPRFRDKIAIFHFGGHASGTQIVLEDEQGAPAPGHAVGLAEYLGQQQGLVLVILNGCSTQPQVERLRARGIKAVVATSEAIDDEVASVFAEELYAHLRDGVPLRRAFDSTTSIIRLMRGEHLHRVSRDLPAERSLEATPGEVPWSLACDAGMDGWTLVGGTVPSDAAPAQAPEPGAVRRALRRLLQEVMEPWQLRSLVQSRMPEVDTAAWPLSPSIEGDLEQLERKGHLTPKLFAALGRRRPDQREAIDRIASAWALVPKSRP